MSAHDDDNSRHPAWHAICAGARLPTRVARHPPPPRTLWSPTQTKERSDDDVHTDPHRAAGRRHPRRRGRRAVPAPPAARAGPAGARDRQGGRRRRHLVVEPLPRRALRQRGLHLPVPTSTRSSTRTGAGARSSPASPRSSSGCSTSPTGSTCARTSSSPPTHHQRPLRRGPRPLDDHAPTAATSSTPSSSSAARACCPRRWRTSSRARTASAARSCTPRSGPPAGIDLAGKRVGVVGIGATGIQVIQTIADEVDHLTVFARTPQYVLPMKSPHYGPEEQAAYKARFDELKATIPHTFTGFEYDLVHAWADCTPEQRLEVLEEIYADGSLKLWLASFGEMFFSPEVSEEISEFVRGQDARPAARTTRTSRRPDAHRLRLRHPPRAAGAQLPGGLPPRQRRPGRRARQPDRPHRPEGHRARRRHRPRARRDRAGHRLRRGHRLAHPHRRPRPRRAAASPRTGAATSAR